MAEGKRFDFERTCVDEKQAEYIKKTVIEEYQDHPKWTVGESRIEKLPSGEYKVIVELTFKELDKKEENGQGIRY